jgi:NADH-quinone oxidoreductase subunit G
VDANSAFLNVDEITPAPWGDFGKEGEVSSTPLRSPIDNFYMTDPISRASATMAACTEQLGGGKGKKTGTDV